MSQTITVGGSFRHYQRAERGTVTIELAMEGPQRDPVATEATALHNALVARAEHYRANNQATWHDATRVWVRATNKYVGNDKPYLKVFSSSSSITIKFSDFAALAELAAELSRTTGVAAYPITWTLTEPSEKRLLAGARAEAVKDAIASAHEYLAAFSNHTSPQLMSLIEADLYPQQSSHSAGAFARGSSAAMSAAAPAGSVAEITPSSIEVGAKVVATFTF